MSKPTQRKSPTGIRARHGRGCRSRDGGRCSCSPSYEAWTFDAREGKEIRKTFPTLAAARAWTADATGAVRRGQLRAVQAPTLREAAEAWLAGVHEGSIRNRSGDAYKQSAIRGYDAALALAVGAATEHARPGPPGRPRSGEWLQTSSGVHVPEAPTPRHGSFRSRGSSLGKSRRWRWSRRSTSTTSR